MNDAKNRRVCPEGHIYYKTSTCPACPACEAGRKPDGGMLSLISAPARRALASKGIHDFKDLSKLTETELSQLHGMGPKAISILKDALAKEKLGLKK